MRSFLFSFAGIALFAGVFSFSTLAAEENTPPKKASAEDETFKKLDTDKDGKLSQKELFKLKDGQVAGGLRASFFQRADKNKDGFLTLEEYKAFVVLAKKGVDD